MYHCPIVPFVRVEDFDYFVDIVVGDDDCDDDYYYYCFEYGESGVNDGGGSDGTSFSKFVRCGYCC